MTHRDVNNCLAVFVATIACYILLAPFLPQLDYIFNSPNKLPAPAFVTATTNNEPKNNAPAPTEQSPTPATQQPQNGQVINAAQNQLYIPSIGALASILEGTDPHTVDKGLWRRPATTTPDKIGNMVVVGHRFSYNHGVIQPFYHLDKLKIGDKIYISWAGKTYVYIAASKRVVPPTESSVEAPTPQQQLTLYTCTPLLNPKDRLVITALPESQTL